MRKQKIVAIGVCGLYVTSLAVASMFVGYAWENPVSGNWSAAALWAPDGVPDGPGNSAVIGATGSGYTVTLSQNVTDLDSLSVTSANATLSSTNRVLSADDILLSAGTTVLNNSAWTGSNSFANAATLQLFGNSTLAGPFQNTGTLTANASNTHAVMTMSNGVQNNGIFNITNAGGGYTIQLSVNGGSLNNLSGGQLAFQAGSGGTRILDGQLLNSGTVTVDGFTRLGRNGVTHVNSGTFTISAGDTLLLDQGGSSFDQSGGTLNVNGAFSISAGTFVFSGGTVNGRPLVQNASLTFPNGTTGVGEVAMVGTSLLTGGPNPNQAVFTSGSGTNTVTTATGSLTNNGVIELSSAGGGYSNTLTLASGTITNNGTLRTIPGSGGTKALQSNLVNNGTLDLGGSTAFNKNGGVYTNNGVVNITAGTSMNSLSQTFNQDEGEINVTGSFTVDANTFNFNGGDITGIPFMYNTVLNTTSSGSGTINLLGNSTITGTVGVNKGVNVFASGLNTNVTSPSGFVNAGTMTMNTAGGGYVSSVSVTSGVFLNSGTLSSLPGTGGFRTIAGDFTNTGTFNVSSPTVFSKTNGVYNNSGGTINLTSSLSYSGGSQVFNLNGGVINGGNNFSQSNATFNLNGGTFNGTGTITNGTLNITGSGTGLAAFRMRGTSTLTGNVKPLQTIYSSGSDANASLGSPVSYENAGALIMDSSGGGYTSTLSLTTGTLLNSGSLTCNPGAGGARTISAELNNTGSININAGTTLSKTDALHRSTGLVALTGPFTVSGANQTFTQNGGTVTGGDLFAINSARYVFNGGTVSGKPRITSGTLEVGPSSTGAGQFFVSGLSNLVGDIKPAQTVHLQGKDANATIISSNGFTNQGTLLLDSSGGGYAVSQSVITGSLTNSGTFSVNPGSGGPRTLTASLVNQGTVNINYPTTFNKPSGLHINSGGTFNVNTTLAVSGGNPTFRQTGGTLAAGTSFSLFGGTFEFLGGTITGQPYLRTSTLSVGPTATIPATIIVGGNSTLVSNLVFGNDIVVQGNDTDSSASFTSATGFSNAGTIRLESAGGGYNSQMVITSGTLLQQPSGKLVLNPGAGGARTATATLNNNGLVEFNAAGSVGRTGAAHTNGGTLRVAGNQTGTIVGTSFTVSGSGRVEGQGTLTIPGFSNGGTVAPGLPVGKLTVNGTHTQTATGSVAVDLGGNVQGGDYDWYAVSGTASVNGTLQVRLVNGFDPPSNTEFTVMTASSLTGAFSTLDLVDFPPNKSAEIVYTANSVKVRIKDGTQLNADSYLITIGEELTGGLTSLHSSDNNRLSMFPDPFTLVTQVEITATAPTNTLASFRITLEASVARTGMAQVLETFNYSTNSWVVLRGIVGTSNDSVISPTVGVNASNYVGPANIMKMRVTWSPINDEDPVQDGWPQNIDVAGWTLAL